MNLMHMKYMLAVEKYGSISKAASALYMGQPNLSKAIKEMEQEIGTPIFKRSVKGVVPTEKGRKFLIYAKEILASLDKIENLHKDKPERTASFKLLVAGASYITSAFAGFLKKIYKTDSIDICFKESSAMETIDSVVDGECDLGIIRYDTAYEKFFSAMLEERKLIATEIWTYDDTVLVSKEDVLSAATAVSKKMIDDHIEITHDENNDTAPVISKKSIAPDSDKKQIVINEREARLNVLSKITGTYMWSPPLPEAVLERYGLAQLESKDIKRTNCDVLISRKDYTMTDFDIMFLEELKTVKNKLIKN